VSRVFIRFAVARDAGRLISDGVLRNVATTTPWRARVDNWLAEQQAGRRLILVAENASHLLGTAQIVFTFPPGLDDPETANGKDVAMMEMLQLRRDAPKGLAERLIADVENVARKRSVQTLTFCVPMNNDRAVAQARSWGFQEFRIMPDGKQMFAFFRRAISES